MIDEGYAEFEAEDSIDVKAFLIKCLQRWYLFALCIAVALIIAVLINQFTEPAYKVTTYLLIRDEENPLDPQIFTGASLYGNPYKLQNEIGILQSKELTNRALRNLNFTVSYFQESRFKATELYTDAPFIVEIDSLYEQPLGIMFNLDFINDTLMVIKTSEKDVFGFNFRLNKSTMIIPAFEFHDTVSFGEFNGNQFCRFRVLPNFEKLGQIHNHSKYSFRFNNMAELISTFRVNDIEVTENSSILSISVRCKHIAKGVDYLNELTEVFLTKGLEREDKIASSTISFIDDQLKGITDSLRFSEDRLQQFRSDRGVTNIDFQAQQTYQQMEDLQDRKAELIVKDKYYAYLKDYLTKNNQVDDLIAPTSMGINDPLLNNLIIQLTELYSERIEMSFNTIKDNPYLSSIELKINDIKVKVLENIDNIINTSGISLNEIDSRIAKIETEINKLPKSQRELLVIERKFKLNDAICTYLLTKRSEVQISKASNIPSNEVLDRASPDDFIQVSPNTRTNYIIALLLGILVPASFIYLRDYFGNKIVDKKEIQSITDTPIVGHIIHNTIKANLVVNENPTSLIAESFRSLRTNFQFFPDGEGKKVILVTSIIKGEGKSFIAINLGTVFAQNQKKVVILDFDLRQAKTGYYSGMETKEGISRFLSNNTGLKDIIFPTDVLNLDIIPSGSVPPNPTELISCDRTAMLLEELQKSYDIVLIDSPPMAMVSDALLLMRYASIIFVVVRQDFTPKNLFATIINDLEKRAITSLRIIINDEKPSQNGYGYGYGYGHEEDKPFIKRVLTKVFRS